LPDVDPATIIGGIAALGTTVAYVPQLAKCWRTGETGDLSLIMLLVLTSGVALWIVYGVLQRDTVVMAANTASLCLLLGILSFKLREVWRGAPG
jgi:MtN3 and saliva related transmembrane protein